MAALLHEAIQNFIHLFFFLLTLIQLLSKLGKLLLVANVSDQLNSINTAARVDFGLQFFSIFSNSGTGQYQPQPDQRFPSAERLDTTEINDREEIYDSIRAFLGKGR